MKKLLILPFLLVPLFSKPVNTMTVEESISDFDVTVKLYKVHQSRYCLIVNSFDEIQKSIVIDEDVNGARKVYGEILLLYYNIKHKKKVVKVIDGERYTIIQDNSRELQSFMYNLTDYSRLKKYSSFSWIDDNTGKKEKVEDKEIGSSAGDLAKIKATDYLSYLEEIKS